MTYFYSLYWIPLCKIVFQHTLTQYFTITFFFNASVSWEEFTNCADALQLYTNLKCACALLPLSHKIILSADTVSLALNYLLLSLFIIATCCNYFKCVMIHPFDEDNISKWCPAIKREPRLYPRLIVTIAFITTWIQRRKQINNSTEE